MQETTSTLHSPPPSSNKMCPPQASQSSPRPGDSSLNLEHDEEAMRRQLLDVESSFLPHPSTVSVQSEENLSEVTFGAVDFALQAEEAAPLTSPSNQPMRLTERTLSLGSIASGMTGVEWPTPGWEKVKPSRAPSNYFPANLTAAEGANLPMLEEERATHQHHSRDAEHSSSSSLTSRGSRRSQKGVTDKINHLRVRASTKPTVAASSTAPRVEPRKPPAMSTAKPAQRASIGHTRGLTLKEQGSTIDRLQKENFDLKLKIHFLDKALTERSDENVQATIAENAELKVKLTNLEKEKRALRKMVSDLEASMKEQALKEQKLVERESVRPGSRQTSKHSSGSSEARTADTMSSTVVSQLRQENEDLRREVGAQASMLTSRNREKDRLYEEIEKLKLGQLRGEAPRPPTRDRHYLRTASGLRRRSGSGSSGETGASDLSAAERRFHARQCAVLRDDVSVLKIKNGALEKKLEEVLDELEQLDRAKAAREKDVEEDLEIAARDLQAMLAERDEAVSLRQELETDYESLRQDAQREMSRLEGEVEQKVEEVRLVRRELGHRNDRLNAVQSEMRSMSEVVIRLEDDQRASARQMINLQQELQDANAELDTLDKNLRDANLKVERLTVQQESSQGEIAFLRDEQDTDKMKIGELESALERTQDSLHGEGERRKHVELRIEEERQEHEFLSEKEKQEHQTIVEQLHHDIARLEDEVRKLRKHVATAEADAVEAKGSLEAFERNLRDALGETGGTRSSLVRSVNELHRDFDTAVAELESAKSNLADRERILRHRDGLLESAGLESRKLSEMVEKERQARRTDRHHYEQLEKSSRQAIRSATQQEARVLELESARQGDRKRSNALEAQYKDQLLERNNLLLALWNRFSTLCGNDWAHTHGQISGKVPSLEVVSSHFPAFSKKLLLAVTNVEGLMGGFKIRIRKVEKDLWKDYQTLEHGVNSRFKRLDRLESLVHGDWAPTSTSSAENVRLRNENQALRSELQVLQTEDMPSRPNRKMQRVPSGGATTANINHAALAAFTRHHSTSAIEALEKLEGAHNTPNPPPVADHASEERWVHRLRELEKRLKAEREARLLDRSGARKRLEEGRAEYEELKQELERERGRKVP